MANMYGGQSKYLLKIYKIELISSYVMIFFILSFFTFLFLKGILFKISGWVIMVIFSSPIIFIILKEFYKNRLIAKNYMTGSKAESSIWYELKRLPNTYSVFQDLKFEKIGNIDFTVVGPTGIYTIEVKSHKGQIVLSDGKLIRNGNDLEKDFLKQAKSQAFLLCDNLKESNPLLVKDLFVKPVIVFSNKGVEMSFGRKPVESVFVVKKFWLNEIIKDSKSFLDEKIVRLVVISLRSYLVK